MNRCLSFVYNRMDATVPACGEKTERELKLIEDVNSILKKYEHFLPFSFIDIMKLCIVLI